MTPTRSRTLRALTLLAAAGLTAAWSAQAQPPSGEAARAKGGRQPAMPKKSDVVPNEDDYQVLKQKSELELESLLAQVEAKKAEIRLREAEFRLARIAPTVAILDKLDEPVAMNFPNETPLEDVLKYIKSATAGPDDAGIPIYVDPVGLQEADKTMASTVTMNVEGVPLSVTLRLVLRQLGLVYVVKDGLLTVTSKP